MSWLEKQTILFVLFVSCVLVTSDIYKSVMWTTNNPLFSESGPLSRCFGEDLEMRVHLQSSLPIVCPFDFIIMKTLASKPATGVLYENFWIVYDFKSFNSCNISMTYYKNGNPKDRNRKLLECDSPEALKSFTYSIDFKAKTPANSGISFVGGEYYYFLATSDGTDGSLNNTEGGHCSDPKVRMKFKVYICKTQGVDEKCQNVSIGEFLCPSDLPEAATTSPPTKVTSQPSTQITIGPANSTTTRASSSGNNSATSLPTMTTAEATTSATNNTIKKDESNATTLQRQGSQDVLNELSWWKTAAIVSFCFWVLLILIIIVVWYIKRRKKKPGLCFTDINKVTPPDTGPQSPDYGCKKQPNTNNSFNNLSYTDDSEDGKPHAQEMSSFKPNMNHTPVVDPTPTGVYSTPAVDPTPADVYSTPAKNPTPADLFSTPAKNPTPADLFSTPPVYSTPAVDKPHKQTQEKNDMHDNEPGNQHDPGMKSEKIGNGTYGGKESGEKKKHKHTHKHKDKNRNSQVRDVLSLPPLKDEPVVLKSYSPSQEKRIIDVNGGYLDEDQV